MGTRKRYYCVCKFCGKEFMSADMFNEVCFSKKCQRKNKECISRRPTINHSIVEVERMAEKYSRQLKKTVTYGQVSLFLDCGIKTF